MIHSICVRSWPPWIAHKECKCIYEPCRVPLLLLSTSLPSFASCLWFMASSKSHPLFEQSSRLALLSSHRFYFICLMKSLQTWAAKLRISTLDITHCGNLAFFLPLWFYVKSIFADFRGSKTVISTILEALNLIFWEFHTWKFQNIQKP